MNRVATVVLAAALVVTLVVPGNTWAGQREWATAGKILTGVFLAGLLHEACTPRPVYTVVPCEAAPVQQVVIVTAGPAHGPPPCPPPPRPTAIIIHLGSGYRLYQPPGRGHTAWVQVWCARRRQWVTIREHPCLW